MRLSRVIPLLMAIILAATMAPALVSPAQAIRASASHQAMKPRHDLQAAGTEIGNTNHFVVVGRLTTYPKAFLFRKIGNGNYFLYRKIKVKNNGKFRTRIFQHGNDRTCFKVGAPETDTYKQTVIPVGCIYTT
jgi:archaellum component FlaG (FlaF/FlaG flagellin family)